jgi:uncharacterized protein YbbK (DUF523 family)
MSKPDERVIELVRTGQAIPVCPEQLGGLPTPRTPAEIKGGTGADVLDGRAEVVNSKGDDVTGKFVRGAQEVLRIAQSVGATEAIMKARSPSCGCGEIADGTFSEKLINGDGVTSALLKRNHIAIITEEEM